MNLESISEKVGVFSIVLLGSILLSACSTTFELPKQTKEMEAVYLLKYSTWGHHSLAFYHNQMLTEYTYGDWELFALNRRDAWTAWKNMTFLTQGALGRKSIFLKSGDSICERFIGCESVAQFLAPAEKVRLLEQKLQKDYLLNIETEVFNSKEGVFFVKHEVPYWGFHNCNHQLVEWLEFLGAKVSGRVLYDPRLIEGMVPKQKSITVLP